MNQIESAPPLLGLSQRLPPSNLQAEQALLGTLLAEFEHSGVLDEVGGTAYLAQLLSAMVGIINAGEYGRTIHDAWLRRQLIDIGETVVNNAFGADAELDGTKQIEAAEQSLFQLATEGGGNDGGFVSFEI